MQLIEAIRKRHSVRQYKDVAIPEEIVKELEKEIEKINREADLHFQLITNEPKAFDGFLAHYGNFSGVNNYFALVGKNTKDLGEKCGYYGERLVLKAQTLGLNTCWVALTYNKKNTVFKVDDGEKFTVIISVGYGRNRGVARRSKAADEVSNISDNTPEWFKNGVEAALLAPTATNQQKFYLTYDNGKVAAKALTGFYTKMDLGIVKYHFEIGAGKDNFEWK